MKLPNLKGGVKEAAKMLAGLDLISQARVLKDIAKQDPEMAEKIRLNMVTFEDLKHTTVKMLQELLREVSIDDFALALRLGSDELKSHILGNVSSSMRSDIEEILLGPPQLANKVQEAVDKIMDIVRAKAEKGELILKAQNDEEYV